MTCHLPNVGVMMYLEPLIKLLAQHVATQVLADATGRTPMARDDDDGDGKRGRE